MNATQKQVGYALHLLAEKGYDTRYMNAGYKKLGATMRERSGTVSNWLGSMDRGRISKLIEELRS